MTNQKIIFFSFFFHLLNESISSFCSFHFYFLFYGLLWICAALDCPLVVIDNLHLFEQVFKGKKMPGRMGGQQRTVKNVWVYKIDPTRNLIWVKGQVWFSYRICFSNISAYKLNCRFPLKKCLLAGRWSTKMSLPWYFSHRSALKPYVLHSFCFLK